MSTRCSLLVLVLVLVAAVANAFQTPFRAQQRMRGLSLYNDEELYAADAAAASKVDVMMDDDDERELRRIRSTRRIFLVDDELDIREAVGGLLQERGYAVSTFANGREALEALERLGGRLPDCIVSDVRMPDVDGMRLLEALREDPDYVSIPTVLLTAKRETRDRIAGYNAGADAYLPKPFDADELLAIVDNCIAHHGRLNGSQVKMQDLQKDLEEIKYLLLQKGGAGPGVNGFVANTNVFLAPDERRLLELLCDGLQTKEIAGEMYLSKRRVEQLLTRMFRKTECKNRTDLVRWAISTGQVIV